MVNEEKAEFPILELDLTWVFDGTKDFCIPLEYTKPIRTTQCYSYL